jgi:hypothetical protein
VPHEILFLFLFLEFPFGFEDETIACDRNLEIIFLYAGNLGSDDESVILVDNIDLR